MQPASGDNHIAPLLHGPVGITGDAAGRYGHPAIEELGALHAGGFLEAGADGRWADGGDAHFGALAFEFEIGGSAEGVDKGFGGAVGGEEGIGLKGGNGGNVEDAPFIARDHFLEINAGQRVDGLDVEGDHVLLPLGINIIDKAVGTEASVIDEYIDLEAQLLGVLMDGRCGIG